MVSHLLVLITWILSSKLAAGAKAADDLLAYISGGGNFEAQATRATLVRSGYHDSLLDRLSAGEWLFALVAAIVLNIPLLLLSSFFIDSRRLRVAFAALVNSRELFIGLLTSGGLSFKLDWPMQLQ